MKNELRKIVKHRIGLLDESYCRESNKKIYENVIHLPEYKAANLIFCFVGTKDEIDTRDIITHALNSGKCIAVPKCIKRGIMEAYLIQSIQELKAGFQGILEPDTTFAERIEAKSIDLAIIPCLSANTKGQRIGYGGGFYDRYLEQTKAYRVVLCRQKLIYEDIPTEEHDQKMDAIISEDKVTRINYF